MKKPRGTIEERFWRYVQKTDRCWLWIGAEQGDGYGRLWNPGPGPRLLGAHRLSWELHRGPIPDGLWVLHRCDNPLCVNPDHLFLGTNADNVKDMIAKGRHLAGARHPNSKLTDDQARAILANVGHLTIRELAAGYGVSMSTVAAIRRGILRPSLQRGAA